MSVAMILPTHLPLSSTQHNPLQGSQPLRNLAGLMLLACGPGQHAVPTWQARAHVMRGVQLVPVEHGQRLLQCEQRVGGRAVKETAISEVTAKIRMRRREHTSDSVSLDTTRFGVYVGILMGGPCIAGGCVTTGVDTDGSGFITVTIGSCFTAAADGTADIGLAAADSCFTTGVGTRGGIIKDGVGRG